MNEFIESLLERLGERLSEEVIPFLEKKGNEIIDNITKELSPMLNELVSSVSKLNQSNLIVVNTDILTKEKIIYEARTNIVPSATEVAAYKILTDKEYIVYLSYAKDKRLLPEEKNKYIIITANALSRDVDSLFGKSQLIILQ